jgi:GAF domain-containing protein
MPDGEAERLVAVRRYNILDTPPDEPFDRVARLATRLLDVPVALISIADADREWFKAQRGLDQRFDEIDRNAALCAMPIALGKPYTLADVRTEPRAANNPIIVADPTLRAYAAVPLTTHDGHDIGTLCVLDRSVRTFTEEELADLADLASMLMRELELRLAGRRALLAR